MAASDAPAETVKVFVGNLSFKITQTQLKDAFQSAGAVVSANIITRGPRSLGYGFVEFGNQADAEKAVSSLHQTELDGRPINVEIAKPRVPRAEAPASTGESAAKPAGGRPRGTRNFRPRTRSANGPRRPRTSSSSGAASSGAAPASGASSSSSAASSSGPSSSGPAGASSSGPRSRGPRGARRAPRAPRSPSTGAAAPRASPPRDASKTTLFVANLPFSVNDDGLRKIFTDKGFNPKVARVVLRRDRSKGFGFVEFDTEQQQIAARDALDNFTVDARPLIVKIAFAVPEPEAAPAAATPAATN